MRLHSLWRGIQSVLFYYLACTPWTKFVNRRKRRKEGQQAKLEQKALELHSPHIYRHPLPFSTNEHWAEEIRLGPGPPPNRLSKKQRQALRRLRPEEANSNEDTPVNDRSTSKLDLEAEARGKGNLNTTEAARFRERQREDEALWGCEEHAPSIVPSLRSGKTGTSSTRFPPFDRHEHSSGNYIIAINPAVNDLHPPVVSNPAQGNVSNMWMLQPPPKAEIMSGHGTPERSRSTTRTSTSSGRRPREHRLGRTLSERLMEEKLQRGNLLYPNGDTRLLSRTLPPRASPSQATHLGNGGPSSRKRRRNSSGASTARAARSRCHSLDDNIDGAVGLGPAQDRESRTMDRDFAFPHPAPSRPNGVASDGRVHPDASDDDDDDDDANGDSRLLRSQSVDF